VALLAWRRQRLGAGLTGFEVMGRLQRWTWCTALPRPARAAARCPLDGAAGTKRHRRRGQARARFEAVLGAALEAGCIDDAVVAESLAQSQALWHLRESIPLAQAEEGLNIKHDISVPVSAIPGLRGERRRRAAGRLARRAAGQLRPPGRRQPALQRAGTAGRRWRSASWRRGARPSTRIVFDAVARFGGSFSAEHGIGALKRDELPDASRRWRCS
jgi:FAD/FMN-containing dehydrogenase